jgi:hypothetical protein
MDFLSLAKSLFYPLPEIQSEKGCVVTVHNIDPTDELLFLEHSKEMESIHITINNYIHSKERKPITLRDIPKINAAKIVNIVNKGCVIAVKYHLKYVYKNFVFDEDTLYADFRLNGARMCDIELWNQIWSFS